MKFSLKTFLAAALLPVASATSNLMTCASPDTTETDFFHHKVSPMYSENWDISYHGTYKVLTNKLAGESYLLYQCGTEPPAGAEDTYDQVISIPPQAQDSGVNIVSTPMIAYLELLGLRTSISGYIGSPTLVSSPCLIELINSGSVPVASSVGNATILEASGVPTDAITFVSGWTGDTVPEKTIVMQEYEESSFMGTMEWIKAYAAVFNVEDKANEVFDEAICRFEAIENNVASVTSDMQERPKVLWAYYSDYCGGWDVAECPNYYCDFADACDAEILSSSEGSAGLDVCGVPYMTTEEFVAFGQDADHWIYPSSNWNDVYAANEQILNQFVSVANRSVFDYQGQGSNAWFEQRFAEYDVVLNDFCLVSGTVESTLPANRRLWLRNVFTEPVGTLGICEDPAAPLEPSGNAAWSDCDFEHDDQHEDIQDESTQDDTQEENIHDDTQEDEEDHSGHDHAEGEHVDEDTGMVGVDSEEDSGAFTVAPFYAFAASLATLFL